MAVLWIQDTRFIGDVADTIAGALFFNQSCFQVLISMEVNVAGCTAGSAVRAGLLALADLSQLLAWCEA